MSQGSFEARLAEAAREMSAEMSVDDTIDAAVKSACELIDGCDMASLSVLGPRGAETLVVTDESLRQADVLQHDLQQGPTIDALREHVSVSSGGLDTDPRWPLSGARIAAEVGVFSVLSFRLFVAGPTLGALSLYSRERHGFSAEDVDRGFSIATNVAIAVAAAQQIDHLHAAVDSRTVIGQALGILMERFDLSPTSAFAVLRRVSSEENRKLHLVATDLVSTRITPGHTGMGTQPSGTGR